MGTAETVAQAVAWANTWVYWLTLIVFNAATSLLVYRVGSSVDWRSAATEKVGDNAKPDPSAILTAQAKLEAATIALKKAAETVAEVKASGASPAIIATSQKNFEEAQSDITTKQRALAEAATSNVHDTSYSRVAGLIGLLVLAMFTWALGNVILHYAFAEPSTIETILSKTTNFFLGGSALFAPYAFNQLSAAFGKGSQT